MIRRYSVRTSVLVIGLCALIAACGQNDAETAAGEPEAGEAAAPTAAATAATGTSSLWRDGAVAPLDVQVAHPNGVVLQLTSLQSRATETALGVRILNGRDREVKLNRFNNRNGYIVMDNGERIYLSPPPSNQDLTIQPGQTLEGELVFLGRLPPTPGAILVLNENASGNSEYSTTPGFRIPLPVAEGATTAAAGTTS